MRIALLSDTHLGARQSLDDLGPQAAEFLARADLILHAGDVVTPAHLDWCGQFAPLLAARGNNDHLEDARMQDVVILEREGWRIGVVHIADSPEDERALQILKQQEYGDDTLDILLCGDSHYERLEYFAGTLMLDSASPTLPHHRNTRLGSMAFLDVTRDGVHAEIVPLGETPGLPNPVTAACIDFDRGGVRSASVGGVAVEPVGGVVRWRSGRGRNAGA